MIVCGKVSSDSPGWCSLRRCASSASFPPFFLKAAAHRRWSARFSTWRLPAEHCQSEGGQSLSRCGRALRRFDLDELTALGRPGRRWADRWWTSGRRSLWQHRGGAYLLLGPLSDHQQCPRAFGGRELLGRSKNCRCTHWRGLDWRESKFRRVFAEVFSFQTAALKWLKMGLLLEWCFEQSRLSYSCSAEFPPVLRKCPKGWHFHVDDKTAVLTRTVSRWRWSVRRPAWSKRIAETV